MMIIMTRMPVPVSPLLNELSNNILQTRVVGPLGQAQNSDGTATGIMMPGPGPNSESGSAQAQASSLSSYYDKSVT
jgi:hypothetical protein